MKNKIINKKLDKYSNLSKDENKKYKFYLVDLEIKEILFKYLEILEDSLKAQLVKKVGDNFLSEEIFREKFLEKRTKFNKEKIEELKSRNIKINKNNFFIELTFGELVRYFKDLKNEYKEKIIGSYGFRKFSIFESWFFSIRYLRNLVCHGENIFNRNFGEKPLGKKLYKVFKLKTNDFILYIAILEIFGIVLEIDREFLFTKIKNILNKQKNLPVGGQISKIDIEAWQVFIQQLYSSFVISQEKKEFFVKNKENNKKTILITGGTGYIGSHGVVAFEQAGYKTVIVDNLSNSNLKTLDGIEKILGYKPDFFEIDLRDKDKLEEIFEKYNFDGVIHFAGLKSPFESQKKPILYFQNNISGSINLFELMIKYNVGNIVFSSSANTYSISNIPPIKENCLQSTTNPYGTSKFLLEKILEDLSKFSKINVINLRYFNPIGAHESGELGELPEGKPNNLFPFIFKVLFGELDELKIFGGDYNTLDGTGIRDYIDVIDLVNAHLLAYNKISKNNQEGYLNSFNVGTGKGITVLEVIQSVEKVLGRNVNHKIIGRRPGDIPVSFCDTTKIEKELGFRAKISLEDSIKNSWKFYNK